MSALRMLSHYAPQCVLGASSQREPPDRTFPEYQSTSTSPPVPGAVAALRYALCAVTLLLCMPVRRCSASPTGASRPLNAAVACFAGLLRPHSTHCSAVAFLKCILDCCAEWQSACNVLDVHLSSTVWYQAVTGAWREADLSVAELYAASGAPSGTRLRTYSAVGLPGANPRSRKKLNAAGSPNM